MELGVQVVGVGAAAQALGQELARGQLEAGPPVVARSGGQPAHAAAWDDPALDVLAGGFYSRTRSTIEAAWVRPREHWWPGLQLAAGELLTEGLRRRADPDDLNAQLHELHRRCRG